MKQYIVAGNWKMHKDVQEANIFVLICLKIF
jgi:triosephosphate isomerase